MEESLSAGNEHEPGMPWATTEEENVGYQNCLLELDATEEDDARIKEDEELADQNELELDVVHAELLDSTIGTNGNSDS